MIFQNGIQVTSLEPILSRASSERHKHKFCFLLFWWGKYNRNSLKYSVACWCSMCRYLYSVCSSLKLLHSGWTSLQKTCGWFSRKEIIFLWCFDPKNLWLGCFRNRAAVRRTLLTNLTTRFRNHPSWFFRMTIDFKGQRKKHYEASSAVGFTIRL